MRGSASVLCKKKKKSPAIVPKESVLIANRSLKEIVKMKKKFIITLSITIILTMFLAVPVSAEGMQRNTMGFDEAADHRQVIKISSTPANKFNRCVFNRRIIFTSHGIRLNFGRLIKRHNLCLY